MLFIDFTCLNQQFVYAIDQQWKNFWITIAHLYPKMSFRFVTESKISISDLPANTELTYIVKNKLGNLLSAEKAFNKAVKPLIDGSEHSYWITNQITHILEGETKQLFCVDDLEWLKFPQWQIPGRAEIKKKDWQKKSKQALHFATVSKHYSGILKNELAVPPERINIFYPLCDGAIKPASWAEKESIKTQYTGGNDFFVFAGDMHDRHHIIHLLKAYSIFKKWQKSSMQLLIIGNTTEHSAKILQSIESYKYRNDIVVVSDPGSPEKRRIISAAYACLYTAESIQFPITMPEAMKSGVPLIVSDIPNMRELGLDHVLYANATDETQIAEKMILLFKDETLRNRLIEDALHIAATFSMDKIEASFFAMGHSLFPANFAATIN